MAKTDHNDDIPKPKMRMELRCYWDTQAVNNPGPKIPDAGDAHAHDVYGSAVEIVVPENMARFIFPATTSSYDWAMVKMRMETELYQLMLNMTRTTLDGRRR